jgi:outer membrane receptor protein involved in Fe transport
VNDTTQNIGGVKTTGIDINGSYSYEVAGIGNFSATYVGTFLQDIVTDTGLSGPGVTPTYDCAGLYGNVCGTPNPKYRHTARIGWTSTFGIGASVRWRHFSGVIADTRSTNSNLAGLTAPSNARIDPVDYFDLALNARIGKSYSFRLGVNNILDKSPPITGSGARSACPSGPCNGNSWAQVYDPLGRYLFAGVTLDF